MVNAIDSCLEDINFHQQTNGMHVCLVTSKRPFEILYGGEQKFTISFGRWLSRKGYEVTIVGRKLFRIEAIQPYHSSGNARSRRNSVPLPYVLALPYPIAVLSMLCVSFLLLMKIIDVNRKKRISVIHAQDSYAGLAGLIASRVLKVPVIMHSHGLRINTMSKTLEGAWKFMLIYESALENFTAKNADVIIMVNAVGRDYFVRSGVKKEKIHVIPVGIDVSSFELKNNNERKTVRKELGIQSDVALGFIGRFSPEKNLIGLLAAFYEVLKQKANIKLILVGAGPMNGLLKKLVYDRSVNDKVIFTGIRYDVNRLLSALDIFILPSYTEGCPTSLLEAMACGKAIIASDIPSIREIVRNGEEAILVNPYDVEGLKQAILLLYNNSDQRTKFGCKARERAKLYDVDKVYGQILDVYEELVRCKAK